MCRHNVNLLCLLFSVRVYSVLYCGNTEWSGNKNKVIHLYFMTTLKILNSQFNKFIINIIIYLIIIVLVFSFLKKTRGKTILFSRDRFVMTPDQSIATDLLATPGLELGGVGHTHLQLVYVVNRDLTSYTQHTGRDSLVRIVN